jgi:hypothetical protein
MKTLALALTAAVGLGLAANGAEACGPGGYGGFGGGYGGYSQGYGLGYGAYSPSIYRQSAYNNFYNQAPLYQPSYTPSCYSNFNSYGSYPSIGYGQPSLGYGY